MEIKKRKGVSPIIATILLILLSIAAISIITKVIFPFVRDSLREGKECFEINMPEGVKVDTEGGYACYDSSIGQVKVTVHRGAVEIKGFRLGVYGRGSSEVYDIEEGVQIDNVKMMDGSLLLVLPSKGGEKTYLIDTALTERVMIVPISISGNLCEGTSEAVLIPC